MALDTLRMYLRRTERVARASDLYRHRVGLLEGGELDLATWRGQPALIVNTASRCGFTGQFAGLQELHERYADDGLRILGCPSPDFAGQEHDDPEAIGAVCRRNYGVTFAMAEAMSVRAEPAHPLWEDLARQPGSKPPSWNFTKYLVGPEGELLERFSTRTTPTDARVTAAIEAALTRQR